MEVHAVNLKNVHQDQMMRVDIIKTNSTTGACTKERLQPLVASVICRDRRGNTLYTLAAKGF